jgi:two-component system OmpR family response regulator
MSKILLVDDETALLETLRINLQREQHTVVTATTGTAAVRLARAERPDLIILDVMLPELDGFEVCRMLRSEMTTPILMLTARDDQTDKVIGLELGADDYMTKPFHLRELLARVKAMLRRAEMSRQAPTLAAEEQLTAGDLELSPARHRVMLRGAELNLRPKEFDLLAHLMRHPGLALSRDQLMSAVWDYDYPGDARTVDVHIRWLREKIEDDPSHPRRIETVRNVGYRFNG